MCFNRFSKRRTWCSHKLIKTCKLSSWYRVHKNSTPSSTLREVYYGFYRADGPDKAGEILDNIICSSIEIISKTSIPLLKSAGRFKANHKIAYADSYALALTKTEDAILVTTDHHELDPIDEAQLISIYWLR